MTEENPYANFVDDAPDPEALQDLGTLAQELHEAELDVLAKEEALRLAQQRVREISEQQIPEVMQQAGLSELKTSSGAKLKLQDSVRASISAAKREDAHRWLSENGCGDLIKHTVKVQLGRGEQATHRALIETLESAGLAYTDDQRVAPPTLKKFVKDRLEEGGELPMELFGASVFTRAKIEAPKESHFGE